MSGPAWRQVPEDDVRHTSWCTPDTHHYDTGQCLSPAIEIGSGACWVWLEQDRNETESPTFVVDAPRDGASLNAEEAEQLCAALDRLKEQAGG